MTEDPRVALGDEGFLDFVFERALELLGRGLEPEVDELLEGQEHLREQALPVIDLARRIALARPYSRPRVEGYEILHELGRGAMGSVFLAQQLKLRARPVALKVLPEGQRLSARARERFLAESRSLARLRHPNVVAVHDVLESAGVCAYAMEWVEGTTLARLIAHMKAGGAAPVLERAARFLGAPSERKLAENYTLYICQLGIELARALSAVHAAGLLHRDIKPSNVLLRRDGTALLSDFGLARDPDEPSQTQTGQFLGTLAYASPEQILGKSAALDARSDVYSLGVTLYQALALELPWSSASTSEILRSIETGALVPLRSRAPWIPRDLETIVHKALEREPTQRYATAADVALDLERLLRLEPIHARAVRGWTRFAKLMRRNRRALVGAVSGATAMVAVSMLAGIYAWRAPREIERLRQDAQLLLVVPETYDSLFPLAWRAPEVAGQPVASTEMPELGSRLVDALALYDRALARDPLSLFSVTEDLAFERNIVALADSIRSSAESRDSLAEALGPQLPLTQRVARAWTFAATPPEIPAAELARASPLDRHATGLLAFLLGGVDLAAAAWSTRPIDAEPDALADGALGELYLILERPDLAYPRFLSAFRAAPGSAFLCSELADCAVRQGNLDVAAELLERESHLRPADTFETAARVRADLCRARGELTQARRIYEEQVQRHSGPRLLRHYASLLEALGEHPLAIQVRRQNLRAHPEVALYQSELRASAEAWWQQLSHEERWRTVRGFLDGASSPVGDLGALLRELNRERLAFASPSTRKLGPSPSPTPTSPQKSATPARQNSSLPIQFPDLLGLAERMSLNSTDPELFRSLPSPLKDLLSLFWMIPMTSFSREPLRTLIHTFFLTCALAGSSPGQTPSWEAQVLDDIREGEYEYQPVASETGVWSAPNRSQGLRSRISPNGLEVFPRTTSAHGLGAPWKLSLRTSSFGRVGDALELGPASLTVQDRRAELDHGPIVEFFENREDGIEQGWTIAAPPRGSDPLWIGLEFAGELSLRIDDGGRSAILVDSRGEARLRYRDLKVFDATGRELSARLTPGPEGVGIQIDDANAIYPVLVDPVLNGPAWTAESDQVGANFGLAVATAGDVDGDGYSDVIIGAWSYDNGQIDEGQAYLYLGSASGLSTTADWTAEGDQASSFFGFSVATAGDVNGDGFSDVIVGAYKYADGQPNEGAAFVYLGSISGLGPNGTPGNADWRAESDQAGAIFGVSVSSAGDVNGDGYSDVIVSASEFDNVQTDEGRAFVYHGSASGLLTNANWTAESDQVSAHFGRSVSSAGDVNGDGYSDVIVAATFYDNGETNEGRAMVFMGSATGLSAIPAWIAETNQVSATLRWVSNAGDINGDGYGDVIVGSQSYDNGQSDEGAAFVYLGSITGLGPNGTPGNADWRAESDQANAFFGYSVSSAGDVNGDGYGDVIVGAVYFDNDEVDEGRVLAYLGSPGGLSLSASWTSEPDQTGANFGSCVSSAGDVNGDGYSDVIVGAMLYDNDQADEGRAYVYHGSAVGLAESAAWIGESDQAGASFGHSVATAGDVNGDGFSDVIVGAYLYDNGESDEGLAFVYLGSASGLDNTAAWRAESNQVGARFGWSVSAGGDVNGDGYGDVIIGAYLYDNGHGDEGGAFLYLGSPSGLGPNGTPGNADWAVESDQADAYLGISVATAGDVNGDGFGDVIVGAYSFDNGEADEGRAYVYLGSTSSLSTSAAWLAESNQVFALLGVSVGTAGDVNGDGYGDVIVGAYLYDNNEMDEGQAFVWLGSPTGLGPNGDPSNADWMAESNQATGGLGRSVATAGDVNGDRYSDVIVGAFGYSNPEVDEGATFAFYGSATGLGATGNPGNADWMAEGNQADAQFGISVATAGDVNGDGYSDVIIGASQYDNGLSNEGGAFVYLGSASGLGGIGNPGNASWRVESNQDSAFMGQAVAAAGDVNGDGYGDVIVGAYFFDNGHTNEGRAFLFLGNDGSGGWTKALQQRRPSDLAPIDLLGKSNHSLAFRIQLAFEKSLAGFTWASPAAPTARLEWQIADLGVALGTRPLESGSTQGITGLPLIFNELVDFPLSLPAPTANRSYHWRARLRTNNPLLPVTPWVTIPWNGESEAKLRAPTAVRRR